MDRDQRRAESLARLMEPKSVAIVGASPKGFGRTVVENFLRLGRPGPVIGVNPKYEEVLGIPCVASLDAVDFEPDAVVLSVARDRVVPALESAAAIGARGAVVFAFGFAETGDEGKALQARMTEVAAAAGMALVGPNCQGIVNFKTATALYMDSVHPYAAGSVALIAESGSFVTCLINNRRGVRWSHAVSSGNEAVTDAADLLGYFATVDGVSVICAQLETIRRPEEFFAACDLARENGRRVVVCTTGWTAEGQAAAKAHSGALALPQRLVEAALRRHGVAAVASLEELLETAIALQSRRRPKGGRLAVLTASGGQIELVHDNMPGTGLSIPAFGQTTVEALAKVLPPLLNNRNPLDWWGIPDYDENLPGVVRTVAADENIDIVVQVGDFTVGPTGDRNRSVGALEAARKVRDEREELLVVLDGVGGVPRPDDVETALEEEFLVLSGFGSGLKAVGHLVDAWTPRAPARVVRPLPTVRELWEVSAGTLIGGTPALDIVAAADVNVVRGGVVQCADDAVELATSIGFPVVVKLGDGDVAHKTEKDGVFLGVSSEDEVREAANCLFTSGTRAIRVEQQVTQGLELLLGVQRRPPLGSFVVVGLGGVWAELLDDVQIRPVGLRKGEAEAMLRALRAFPLLEGARGRPALDVGAVTRSIEAIDDLALELGDELDSLDVNPLIVLQHGAVAVDALLLRRA
jgi:acetate---CoA ligase (ADP-forming)